MIQFIKKNKVFVTILTVIVLFIGAIGVYVLQGDNLIDIAVPPLLVDPSDEEEPLLDPHMRATITNFYGNFDDQGNTVFLYWNLKQNDSIVDKVELYSQDLFIADVTNTNMYEMPITVYQFATGNNEFELRCSLKNELSISEKTVVSVNYIFDIERTHSVVDHEEFGKGIEVIISYTYNRSTPVGVPNLIVKDLKGTHVSTTFISNEDLQVVNNYVTSKTTYFFQINGYEPNTYTWNAQWNFDAVSLSFDYTMQEVIEDVIPDVEEVPEESQEEEVE